MSICTTVRFQYAWWGAALLLRSTLEQGAKLHRTGVGSRLQNSRDVRACATKSLSSECWAGEDTESPEMYGQHAWWSLSSRHHLGGKNDLHILSVPVVGSVDQRLREIGFIGEKLRRDLCAVVRNPGRNHNRLFGRRIKDS